MSDAGPEEAAPAEGGEREERYRLAAVAASVPLMLLTSPLFLPVFDNKSFLDQARREPSALAVVSFLFFWPLLVGALGLRAGIVRRAPGKVAFAVPAALYMLGALATHVVLFGIMCGRSHARQETVASVVAICSLLVVYILGRGFRRTGWERWGQLVAGAWMLCALWSTLIAAERRGPFDGPELGAWMWLFALSAATPAAAWILWPKRKSPAG